MTVTESSLPSTVTLLNGEDPSTQVASPIHPNQTDQHFIVAQVDKLTIVFPSAMVAEMLIIERSKILALPFYEQAVLGCVHNAGQIIPLVSMHPIFRTKAGLTKESLTVVRLADIAGVAGIGLVVDRILGSKSPEQLPNDVFTNDLLLDSEVADLEMWLFRPEVLSSHFWQPQRYFKP